MKYPNKETFLERAQDKQSNLLGVRTELHNDALTPMAVFRSLQEQSNDAFLLESVEHGKQMGRYTFVGLDSVAVIVYQEGVLHIQHKGQDDLRQSCCDPFPLIRDYLSLFKPLFEGGDIPPFVGGAVGYIGYDVIRVAEDIPQTVKDDLQIPDIFLMVTDRVLVFDHLKHKIHVVGSAYLDDDRSKDHLLDIYDTTCGDIDAFIDTSLCHFKVDVGAAVGRSQSVIITPEDCEAMSNQTSEDYKQAVLKAKDYIVAGDILQVVLSQRFAVPTKADPLDIYCVLRSLNPSPYMFYFKCGSFVLTGSSPETMVRLQDGGVLTKPMAGTRPRGATDEEDQALAQELLDDPKERAEHLMLVDLGRNDIGRIAKASSVEVNTFMAVEKYSHVMHIVSEVEGRILEDLDSFDAVLATFPAGTLSGAPKIRAMEIIDELEPTKRATYGGLAGYFGFDGHMDTCITIRSMVCKDGKAYVQAGAGIVADSDPDKEYQECMNKAMAVIRAIKLAEG